MDWKWRRDGRGFVAAVPTRIGQGTVRAERSDEGWWLVVGDWETSILNPRLTSWLSAREIVEIVVRCHFQGSVLANSTGTMMVGAR